MFKAFLLVLLVYPLGVPAPVPRCSPFIIINKLAEHSSILSDSNPYFPVPPCEYGSPLNALKAKDLKAVFVTAEPQKIPQHNFYEFIWLLKTGIPRMIRVAMGQEELVVDNNILREGYSHYSSRPRTTQLGFGTRRRPEIIDNKAIYGRVVGNNIRDLIRSGPDRVPTAYTPQGPLKRRRGSSTLSKSGSNSSRRTVKALKSPYSASSSRSRNYRRRPQPSNRRPFIPSTKTFTSSNGFKPITRYQA